MPKGMTWIKLYTEMLDDPKVGRLPDALKWRYTSLCLLAGECDAGGALLDGDAPLDIADLAWRLRCAEDELAEQIRDLVAADLLHYDEAVLVVSGFASRNGVSAEDRRRQWRESQSKRRQDEEEGPEDVNGEEENVNAESKLTQRGVNALETETETEAEAEAPRERQRRKKRAPPDSPDPPPPQSERPPAAAVYRAEAHLWPAKTLFPDLAAVTDLEFWQRVVHAWIASGFNPRNLAGMLECYHRHEIPGTKKPARQRGGRSDIFDPNDPKYTTGQYAHLFRQETAPG